jgi:hypothetical protein
MAHTIKIDETGFSINTDMVWAGGSQWPEFRVLFVSHIPRWETEPGFWRDEQVMILVSNTSNLKTSSVALSRDDAVALSEWLARKLA